MGADSLAELMKRHAGRIQSLLNILIESPYFYSSDDRNGDLFPFLLRNKSQFREFFEYYYGWELIIDAGQKCARVYKSKWYNPAISESRRFALHLTRRDETLAFMLLLEFFELQLDEQNESVEEKDNLRFDSGELLIFVKRRLREEYPSNVDSYSEEAVRRILRQLIPKLVQFRLLEEVKPPEGQNFNIEQKIYEALPALYHYNSSRLSFPVFSTTERTSVVEEEPGFDSDKEDNGGSHNPDRNGKDSDELNEGLNHAD